MFKIMTKKEYRKLIDEMDYLVKRRELAEQDNQKLIEEKTRFERGCVEGKYCHICENHYEYKEADINRYGDIIYLDKIGCKNNHACRSFVDNTVVKIS